MPASCVQFSLSSLGAARKIDQDGHNLSCQWCILSNQGARCWAQGPNRIPGLGVVRAVASGISSSACVSVFYLYTNPASVCSRGNQVYQPNATSLDSPVPWHMQAYLLPNYVARLPSNNIVLYQTRCDMPFSDGWFAAGGAQDTPK